MADENVQDPSAPVNEQDAKTREKVDVNPAVTVEHEPQPYGEYLKQNESQQETLKKYGYTDLQQFLTMVGSDGQFAQNVVRDLIGMEPDKPFLAAKESFASQEKNVTGTLSHTGDTAVKATPTGSEPVVK